MKRLIVCFDGTWNSADKGDAPTNVLRIARMIPPMDSKGIIQSVFYDQGVGTGNAVDKLVGGALGEGLEDHVKLGYSFLAQNYEPGDEIYIYGFSRGAFTARSLCGFIGAARGLLNRDKLYKIADAWNYYRTPPAERNTFVLRNEIQSNVRTDVTIKLLGVWDTVGSLGIPTDIFNSINRAKYAFHDTALSTLVEHAFQALAIDEKRGPFAPTLWDKPAKQIANQIVEQVWFPGVHSDVGGGYQNSELSDLTLRWMLARTMSHTKLEFDTDKVSYFVPELAQALVAKDEMSNKATAINRIQEKWKGPLHDSLGFYAASRISPRLRVIGGQKPKRGPGPLKKLFRVTDSGKPFCEAIHWSALLRFKVARDMGLPKYDPPNLRVAIDDLKSIDMDAEVKPGRSWWPE